ncbi:unnamed protein product [Clavelina lepadiformis]|uniref:Guanine nucleotide-binding protein subunit beta-like protein 1 n=1 Tax=Clavelina lepadiformis TaxID=159417 RepID=A0ABP0F4C2_CLALP
MSDISPEYVLKRLGKPVTDLNFWSSGSTQPFLLASYGENGGVDLWDLKTKRSACHIASHAPMLSCYGMNTGEVITFDKEGQLKLVKIRGAEAVNEVCLSTPNAGFCKAAVLPMHFDSSNAIKVAVPGEEMSSMNVWDLKNTKILSRLIPPDGFKLGMPMCSKLVNVHSNLVAFIGYEDGTMLKWDVTNEKVISKGERLFDEPVMTFDLCNDTALDSAQFGFCASATNELIKWHVETNFSKEANLNSKVEDFQIMKKISLLNPGIASLKIRSDKKIIATGGWDYKVRIFSFKSLKPLAVLQYHTGTVQTVAFSECLQSFGQLLACGSNDNKISVWKLYNS